MLNIAKGRYRCERTFDFGLHGSYDYKYEIRLEQEQMMATGMIHGSLHLPEIVDVERTFTEIMVPCNPWEIRSFARTSFKAASEEIPVSVSGKYTPLMSEETDWHCCARNNQVRRSWINIRQADPQLLSLDYRTVIQAIEEWASEYERDHTYRCDGGSVVPKVSVNAVRSGVCKVAAENACSARLSPKWRASCWNCGQSSASAQATTS